MRWKLFFLITSLLTLGNAFVYAGTTIPTSTPDTSQYNEVPEGALNAINNISPQQISQLPESARQDLARRQQEAQDDLREETIRSTGSTTIDGELPLESSTSSSGGSTSSSTSTSSGLVPLELATNFMADDTNIRQSNIADTLDMATKFEIQLWRQYYNTIAEDVHDLHDVYEDIADSFDDYSDELDSMINRLPHTVSNCQRQ